MPSKLQFYTQMADTTARQVTGSFGEWTAFCFGMEPPLNVFMVPISKILLITKEFSTLLRNIIIQFTPIQCTQMICDQVKTTAITQNIFLEIKALAGY